MADMTFNFNLKPNTTTLDLGDSTNKWQNLYVGTIAATTLQAPTTSGGSTLGVGSSGQFLSSNGTSSYWASLPTASTTAAGIIQIGTGATNACAGNDSRLSNSRTPTAHATTSTTYGGGTASNYGHVALTDTYATVSTSQKAANSIAASAWALQTAYTTLNSNKANSSLFGFYGQSTQARFTAYDANDACVFEQMYKSGARIGSLGCYTNSLAYNLFYNNTWHNQWTMYPVLHSTVNVTWTTNYIIYNFSSNTYVIDMHFAGYQIPSFWYRSNGFTGYTIVSTDGVNRNGQTATIDITYMNGV